MLSANSGTGNGDNRVMRTPLDLLLVALAAWMNQRQQFAIEYLREEIGAVNCAANWRLFGYARKSAP